MRYSRSCAQAVGGKLAAVEAAGQEGSEGGAQQVSLPVCDDEHVGGG